MVHNSVNTTFHTLLYVISLWSEQWLVLGELDFSNYLNDSKGSDEFPVGPARNSTQGCFAHDLHFEDLIDA